jgi:hypothetical protein
MISPSCPARPIIWLQVMQQAGECLLVVVLVLPGGEVGDMSGSLNMRGPTAWTFDHSIIQTNRKQDRGLALTLFGKSGFNLKRHPRAFDRMFGEDQQQFVIQLDRCIDAVPDPISCLHMLRRKPAAHAVALQIIVQAFCKCLVLAGITDEAGIVFNRSSDQGFGILNQSIRDACPFEKDRRDSTFGPHKGIYPNCRWPLMSDALKSFDVTKIKISKDSIQDTNPAEVGFTQISPAEAGPAQVGLAQVGLAQVGVAEVGPEEVGLSQVGLSQSAPAEVDVAEIGIAKVGVAEVGPAYLCPDERGVAEIGIAKVGIAEVGPAEIGIAEVNVIAGVALSPIIPSLNTLLETFQMPLVSHVSFLL